MTVRQTGLSRSEWIPSLSGLRIVLAVLVFLTHLEQVLRSPDAYRMPFIHGGFSVAAFFILSGFLVGRKYSQMFHQFSWDSYRKFLHSRISGIYGLYVISMIPHFTKSLLGISDLESMIRLIMKLGANLLLVQTLWPNGTAASINAVSWFLSCLVLSYCFFPILVKIQSSLRRKGMGAYIVTLMVCFVAVYFIDKIGQLYASPLFRIFQLFIGMQICDMPRFSLDKTVSSAIEIGAVLIAIAAYFGVIPGYITVFDTFACFLLVYVLSWNGTGIASYVLSRPIMLLLSKFSMPFFLVHGPVVFIFGKKLLSILNCSHIGVAVGIMTFTATLLVSFIFLEIQKFHNHVS